MAEGEWLVNPGSVGPAARRRPARRLPDARHRDLDGHVQARRVPDRRGGQGDHRRGPAEVTGGTAVPGALVSGPHAVRASRLMLCVAGAASLAALPCSEPAGTTSSKRAALARRQLPARDARRRSSSASTSQDCTGASQQAAAFREQVDGLPAAGRRQAARGARRRAPTGSRRWSRTSARPSRRHRPTEPAAGTTSEDPTRRGTRRTRRTTAKRTRSPRRRSRDQDQTQTQPPPDTGGAGEEVPGVGDQGGGTSPEG